MTSLASLLKHSRPQRLTFSEWLQAIDSIIASRIGLSHEDLPDCCYLEWYEDGISPGRAAGRAMRAAERPATQPPGCPGGWLIGHPNPISRSKEQAMNFMKAMQYAFKGYGIRRKEWRPDSNMLYWSDGKEQLLWIGSDTQWTPSTTELNDDFYHDDWEAT